MKIENYNLLIKLDGEQISISKNISGVDELRVVEEVEFEETTEKIYIRDLSECIDIMSIDKRFILNIEENITQTTIQLLYGEINISVC